MDISKQIRYNINVRPPFRGQEACTGERTMPEEKRTVSTGTSEGLKRSMEAHANAFNLKCLAVLCLFSLLCEVCNRVGIFVVDERTMRFAVVTSFLAFFTPIGVWLVHDAVMKRSPSVLCWSGFKFLVVFATYVGITVTCVTLTFHAVLLMVLPGIFAAQYPDQKRLLKWVILGSVLLVPLGVYGGFFFGVVDLNLFSGAVGKGALPLAERVAACPPERYLSLFFHYVVPRYLAVLIIEILLFGIGRRNAETTARQMALTEQANAEMKKRNDLQSMIIEKLSSVIESRDENTGEHVVRTKNYVGILAREMQKDGAFRDQLTDELIEEIKSAAPLHDIGKIAISDTILLKPGRLTPEEFEVIKLHTTKGGAMIRTLFSQMEDALFLRLAEEITVYHHEWWDGTGYPTGLKGPEIPLAARIMAVADVYDALVSDRVYKKAVSREEALKIIYGESGTHFDPDIIRILRRIEDRMENAA